MPKNHPLSSNVFVKIITDFFLPPHLPEIDQRYYFIAILHVLVSLFIHILFLIIFVRYDIPYLLEFNLVSIPIFIGCFFLVRQGKFAWSLLISSIEILLHNSLGVHILGIGSGLHFLILVNIVSTPIYIRGNMLLKATISFISTAVVIALVATYTNATPLHAFPEIGVLHWINLSMTGFAMLGIWFGVLFYEYSSVQAHTELQEANSESNRLLNNILPPSISQELKRNPGVLVKRFEHTTILFADIVNFTRISENMSPRELVAMLNNLFSRFDDLCVSYEIEKIKTIGDAYMVAAGVPNHIPNHAERMIQFCKDMLKILDEFNKESPYHLELRVGISSGPVVAGVIGKTKFIYDLWGDTVNTAARMESFGIKGRVQVSEVSYKLLQSQFQFEKRSNVSIKGKGIVNTYLLNDAVMETA